MLSTVTIDSLHAANDGEIVLSFEDMRSFLGIDSDAPCIRAGDYKNNSIHDSMVIRGFNGPIEHAHNPADRPVLMRGAWFVMVDSYSSYNGFRREVVRRYFRRHEVTILNQKDAKKWLFHLFELFREKDFKRWVYSRSNIRFHWSDFYNPSIQLYLIDGKQMFIDGDRLSICKSILRQRKKLDKLFNNTGDREKWQKLIQQAI